MVSKKKVIAIAITTMALTVGTVGVSSAASKNSVKVSIGKGMHLPGAQQDKLAGILSDLVKKGTLTQAQVDALNAAIAAARTAEDAKRITDQATRDADRVAFEALIAKTIGVDAATIKTRLAAGETLGAIAGAKKAELIAVIVADHAKRIDADVAAGKLTAAQATTIKADLVAHVTAEVDSVRGPGMGGKGGPGKGGPGMGDHKGGKGGKGGHGPRGEMTPPPGAPAPGTTTGSTASYKA
jgi:polyhydroxyalkanoate synthesis regulator phasin